MKHGHNHSCVCEHESVKYCKHCSTVYCLNCHQEWKTYSGYYPYSYPQITYTTGTAGNAVNNEYDMSSGWLQSNAMTCKHGA